MAIKKNNPHVQKMLKFAGTIASDNNEPFFGMVESLAFAVADKAITDQREFYDLIQSLRTHKGVATLAENRLSETWSVGELGGYKCVKPLFKAIRSLPSLPSMTGLYDIACSIRQRGSFGKDGDNAKTAIGLKWDKERPDSPPVAALTAAMKQANTARNKGKVAQPKTFEEEIGAMLKRLEKMRDGYNVKRGNKTVAVPANKSPHIADAIAALSKLKSGNGKVVSITSAKRRAA